MEPPNDPLDMADIPLSIIKTFNTLKELLKISCIIGQSGQWKHSQC